MKDLTEGSILKKIIYFATPLLIGNVVQQLNNIIDYIIVGNYSEDGDKALAAIGESFPIIFMLISLIVGFSSGITIIISQYFGAKKFEKVKLSIDTMNIFLFFASIITSTLGIYFSDDIFKLIHVPEDILPYASTYLNIYLVGLIALFGFNGCLAILRGLGDSRTPLVFLICSCILNIVLDILFVAVLKYDVAGAAYATILAQTITFVITILYLNKTHKLIKFTINRINFDLDIFKESVRIGLPSGLQTTFVALGMMALFRIVNEFGADAATAYATAMRVDAFATMPAMAFATALTAFVGQNIGANRIERVKKGYRATVLMTSVISIIISVTLYFFGTTIMGLFTNSEKVIEIGYDYFRIVPFFYITFSILFCNNAVLRGAGATIIPMFITLFALWIIRIPASYYLSGIYDEVGIWWGIPAGWVIGCLFSYIYYIKGNWRNKHVSLNA